MKDGSNLVLWLIRTIVYLTVGLVISKFTEDLFWNIALTVVAGSIVNYFVSKQWREYFG